MHTVCSMKNCKISKDVCPISKLCPSCDAWMKDFNKRSDTQERQQQARDQVHAQNRNINLDMSDSISSGQSPQHPNTVPTMSHNMPHVSSTPGGHHVPPPPPPSSRPPVFNSANFPPVNGATGTSAPPAIDINGLFNSYNTMRSTNNQPPILMDMFALMLNIHSKQSENDEFRVEVKSNTSRIDSIEAKIGGKDDISERLGLAVRRLPLPQPGRTDLDNIRQVFSAITAPGLDVNRDVIKCIRKLPSNPGPNITQPILGTVLVEMRNEEARALVMKNKSSLETNQNEVLRNIVIINMRSKEQMFMQNLGNSILKKIPGCESSYVTPSGQVREGNFRQPPNHHYQHNPHARVPPPQAFPHAHQRHAGPQHDQQKPQQSLQPQQQLMYQRPPPSQYQFHPPAGYQAFNPSTLFYPTNTQAYPTSNQAHPVNTQAYPTSTQAHPVNTQVYPANTQAYPANTQTRPTTQTYPPNSQSPHVPIVPNQPPPTQDPYQSLLLQLDPFNTMRSAPPTPAGPTLHLLQPAAPHYDNTEQEQHSEE